MSLLDAPWNDVQSLVFDGYRQLQYTQYMFVKLPENYKEAVAWINAIKGDICFSKPDMREAYLKKDTVFINIAFTPIGLRRLGLTDQDMHTFSHEFDTGMNSDRASHVLGDTNESRPDIWEWGGGESGDCGFDVLLLVYAFDKKTLNERKESIVKSLERRDHLIHDVSAKWEEREPFGFRDGLSNPVIRGIGKQPSPSGLDPGGYVNAGEFVFGLINERGHLPVSPSVSQSVAAVTNLPPSNTYKKDSEELARYDFGIAGTYLVVRQLLQEVSEFEKFISDVEKILPTTATHVDANTRRDFARAKVIGRWPDGTSLIDAPTCEVKISMQTSPDTNKVPSNNFRYAEKDKHGYLCPLGAHVRRALPRDALGDHSADKSLKFSNRHRILRRGRVFNSSGDIKEPSKERKGVMFVCINTQIGQQFEFIQQKWINNKNFTGAHENIDPVAGMSHSKNSRFAIPDLPMRKSVVCNQRFVTTIGGAYLFMPGRAALDYLGSLDKHVTG